MSVHLYSKFCWIFQQNSSSMDLRTLLDKQKKIGIIIGFKGLKVNTKSQSPHQGHKRKSMNEPKAILWHTSFKHILDLGEQIIISFHHLPSLSKSHKLKIMFIISMFCTAIQYFCTLKTSHDKFSPPLNFATKKLSTTIEFKKMSTLTISTNTYAEVGYPHMIFQSTMKKLFDLDVSMLSCIRNNSVSTIKTEQGDGKRIFFLIFLSYIHWVKKLCNTRWLWLFQRSLYIFTPSSTLVLALFLRVASTNVDVMFTFLSLLIF